jgi:alkanesulfonate monooxygenase
MRKNIDPKVVALKVNQNYPGTRMIGANGGTLPGFVGSYDQVAERIAAFHDIGMITFLLSFFPLVEEQENFARHVIPRVRDLVSRRPPAAQAASRR